MNAAKVTLLSDVSVKTAARLLNLHPNKLFEFLRELHIFSAENMPCGRYTSQGYFRVRITNTPRKPIYMQPRVTERGLVFINELLDGHPQAAQAIRCRNKAAKTNRSAPPSAEKRTTTAAANG